MLVPSVARGAGNGVKDRPRPKRPDVLITTAATGEGVPELLAALDRHRAIGGASPSPSARRIRAEAQVWAVLADRLRDRLHDPAYRALTMELVDAVADHRLDPYAAADRLLDALRSDRG
jgi:LAO/AO transport system kinase